MKNLCLIPARAGSKRVPNKNVKQFAGRAAIEYSLRAAREAALFERVVVSTDSDRIGVYAAKNGAAYLKRSSKTSGDDAQLYAVVMEVLKHYEAEMFDNVCILYPCAPFVTAQQITDGYTILEMQKEADTVFPVTSAGYFERMMRMDDDGKIDIVFSEFTEVPSQEMQPVYQHVGAWFWCRVASLLFNGTILPADTCYGMYVAPWEGWEIDTEIDWMVAEKIYEATH